MLATVNIIMIPGETVTSQDSLGLPRNSHVSPFRVMKSGGGYYVGTVYIHCGECEQCKKDDMPKGFAEPNSRETDYMSKEDAERALQQMLADEEPPELRKTNEPIQ